VVVGVKEQATPLMVALVVVETMNQPQEEQAQLIKDSMVVLTTMLAVLTEAVAVVELAKLETLLRLVVVVMVLLLP
jgi:hypothetical protein